MRKGSWMPGSGKIGEGSKPGDSYVVDASVAARWFIKGEEWEDKALKLLEEYKSGRVELFSVDLLRYEVVNSLWRAVSRGYMSEDDAIAAAEQLSILSPRFIDLSADDWAEVLKTALRLRITAYDSSYLIASKKAGISFITADKEILEKAKGFVIIQLRDYQGPL